MPTCIFYFTRFGLRVVKNLDWDKIQYVESNYRVGFCTYITHALVFALLVLAVELLIAMFITQENNLSAISWQVFAELGQGSCPIKADFTSHRTEQLRKF